MDWQEVTIKTTEEGLDAVCGRLDMLGITNVMVQQDASGIQAFLENEAKYWDYADAKELVSSNTPGVVAYLASGDAEAVERIKSSFEELKHMDVGIDLGSLEISVRNVADEDWANNWKAYFKPLKVGEKLLICPSWEDADAEGRIRLLIDPGMAFGTGSHHTTRLCLEQLEHYAEGCNELLDIGCGSGILSIAGLLMGAKHALGVDIDPLSPKIAAENAALNGIFDDRYQLIAGDIVTDTELLEHLSTKKYDVVCSNIAASVIIMLAPLYKRFLAPNGVIIASGIILERAEEVAAAFAENGLEILEVTQSDDWTAVLARAAAANE